MSKFPKWDDLSTKLNIELIRKELKGKNLACFCELPKPDEIDWCHGAFLLMVANDDRYGMFDEGI